LFCRTFGGSKKNSYPVRSQLLRRRAAEREWLEILPLLVDPYLEWKHSRNPPPPEIESDTVWSIHVLGVEGFVCQSLDVLLLIRSLASHSPTVTVRQHEGENANVALMHIGLLAGTPVLPKLAFSATLIEFFYHLRRQQPSVGVQGFVKASCALTQVRFPLSIHRQMTHFPRTIY